MELTIEILERVALLTLTPAEAAGSLGLDGQHGMWMSSVYRELAERQAQESFRIEPARAMAETTMSVLHEIRKLRGEGGSWSRVAFLLRHLAAGVTLPDRVLVHRILKELDVAVFHRRLG